MRIHIPGRFLFIYILGFLIILILYKSMHNKIQLLPLKLRVEKEELSNVRNSTASKQENKNNTKLFYILQWTSPKNVPFVYMGEGQNAFVEKKCPYTNCYVTSDRDFLGDYTKFDVIAFAGPEVVYYHPMRLPQNRSLHQKYVFANIESAANYPICSDRLNGFFNWTWTYKLDSDSRWGYIVVRDAMGKIIGPNKVMHWMKKENMLPISDNLKKILRGKTKTAAWFVSNCVSLSDRESFVRNLQLELNKYKLKIDIYGACGDMKCSRIDEARCDNKIRSHYHFYLAFENAFSEDYVTEKLLHAVEYNALPIVFGGANYSRFLPEGSYLDAVRLGPQELAKIMNELLHDFDKYSEYFKWTNHYTYHRRAKSVETDDYCGFCALLNDETKVKEIKVYENFREWWDPGFPDLICD